jgi:uncharacterized membrane protein YkoI
MFGLIRPLAAAALFATSLAAPPVHAQNTRDEQGRAREEAEAGNTLKLSEIESIVLPQMRGMQYLGPAYDSAAKAYRLKFIKDGKVYYVDVDARTGRIINRTR